MNRYHSGPDSPRRPVRDHLYDLLLPGEARTPTEDAALTVAAPLEAGAAATPAVPRRRAVSQSLLPAEMANGLDTQQTDSRDRVRQLDAFLRPQDGSPPGSVPANLAPLV